MAFLAFFAVAFFASFFCISSVQADYNAATDDLSATWTVDSTNGITLDGSVMSTANHTGTLTIGSTLTVTLSNGATFEQSGLINPNKNAIVVKGDGTLKITYQGTSLCSNSTCLSGFDIYNDCVVDNSCVYNSTITDSGNMMLCGTSDLLHFHGNGEVIIGRNTWVRQNCTLTVDSNCNAKFSQSTMDGINTNSGFNLTNYTITFDVAKNATLESSVRIFDEGNNKGNIVKTGAGTMTITNSNNVYRGTTTISGGTLIAKSLGSIGTGSLTIGNATMEAAFEGNIPASNVTITGDSTLISSVSWNRFKNLSGSGTLTLIGSGFLAINNSFHARNFTGTFIVGTTTQAGKLSLEVQSNVLNADSGKIKVVNGIVDWRGFEQSFNSLEYLDGEMQNMTGKLTIGNEFKYNSSTALTVPCVIAGNAKLTKDNSGTLTLSGANTYTGGTTISDGTLKLTGSGTLGTGAVTNSGTLEFNNSTTTITPNISGAGDILVSAGTATLSGAVTQTGGATTLADGTTLNIGNASTLYNLAVVDENASATLNITGNLTLNNSDLTKFIGSITAPVVTKTGLDTLQLCFDAENAVNLGSLVVSSGPVDLKGYMSGGITVDSGAVFSPGNSIGEAKYGGGYELKEGATLLLEVGKNEQGDILTDTLTYVPNLTDPKDTVFEGGSIIKIALDSSYDNAFEDGDVAEIQLPAGIKGSNGNDLDMNNLVFQSSMFDLVGYDSTTGILSVRYAEPAAGVPEPSTWALLLLGAAGLLYVRKRTRK